MKILIIIQQSLNNSGRVNFDPLEIVSADTLYNSVINTKMKHINNCIMISHSHIFYGYSILIITNIKINQMFNDMYANIKRIQIVSTHKGFDGVHACKYAWLMFQTQ